MVSDMRLPDFKWRENMELLLNGYKFLSEVRVDNNVQKTVVVVA